MNKKVCSTKEIEEIERVAEAEIQLAYFLAEQVQNSTTYFGYPEIPENNDLAILGISGLSKLHLNNAGDPWIQGNSQMHSKDFEIEALDFVADLYGIKDNYWGYVTSGGTEGNLYGAYMAREYFESHGERPTYLYSSASHYSIPKNGRLLYLPRKEIPSLSHGEMNYKELAKTLMEIENQQGKKTPLILNINIGTTMSGAIDQLDQINSILEKANWPKDKVLIHADAALLGFIYPFMENFIDLFKNGVTSIAVSGHKFPGAIHPCGIVLANKTIHEKAFGEQWVPYVGTSDSTISGSRNGFLALNLWYIFKKKGRSGFQKEAHLCVENAKYLAQKLKDQGVLNVHHFPHQNIVTFNKPSSDMIKKYQLATQGELAHVVVMQHITKARIDLFCRELRGS